MRRRTAESSDRPIPLTSASAAKKTTLAVTRPGTPALVKSALKGRSFCAATLACRVSGTEEREGHVYCVHCGLPRAAGITAREEPAVPHLPSPSPEDSDES